MPCCPGCAASPANTALPATSRSGPPISMSLPAIASPASSWSATPLRTPARSPVPAPTRCSPTSPSSATSISPPGLRPRAWTRTRSLPFTTIRSSRLATPGRWQRPSASARSRSRTGCTGVRSAGRASWRGSAKAPFGGCETGSARAQTAALTPRHRLHCRRQPDRRRLLAPAYPGGLILKNDIVTRTNQTLHQYGGVDAGRSIVILCYVPQNLGILVERLRIDADHAATTIAFQNVDRQFRTDPQSPADKCVFGKASAGIEIDIEVFAKATLVERQAHRAANSVNRLACEQRKRATVRHGAVRAYDGQVGCAELITCDQARQRRIGRRQNFSVRRFDLKRQILARGKQRCQAGTTGFRIGQITRYERQFGTAKSRAKSHHFLPTSRGK